MIIPPADKSKTVSNTHLKPLRNQSKQTREETQTTEGARKDTPIGKYCKYMLLLLLTFTK